MRIHVKRKNKWEDQRLKFCQDKFAEGFTVVGKKKTRCRGNHLLKPVYKR